MATGDSEETFRVLSWTARWVELAARMLGGACAILFAIRKEAVYNGVRGAGG